MEILREQVRDRSAWVAEDYKHDHSWLFEMDTEDLSELDRALRG